MNAETTELDEGLRLIEICEVGRIAEEVLLPDEAHVVCPMFVDVYRANGFQRPWIGYLVELKEQIVGTCAFKSAPRGGRVEIAYYTFPQFEGRGIATRMAQRLITIAGKQVDRVEVFAQTLPCENASTAILRKLGFQLIGTVQHPEDGEVWEWALVS